MSVIPPNLWEIDTEQVAEIHTRLSTLSDNTYAKKWADQLLENVVDTLVDIETYLAIDEDILFITLGRRGLTEIRQVREVLHD